MSQRNPFTAVPPASLIEAIGKMVYVVSAGRDQWRNGRVEYISGHVRTLLGREPEEFISDPGLWISLVHPDDLASLSESTRETYEEGKPVTRSYRLKHALTGEYRLFEDRVVPRFDESGAFVGILGLARDVTESHNLEHHLAIVLDRIADGFFTLDRHMRYTYINRTGAMLVGRSPEQLIGRGLLDVFPEARGSKWEQTYRRVMDTNVHAKVEDHYEPLGRWFEADVFPSIDGISMFFRDITDRKLVERGVQTWLDELPVALVRNTVDGRILQANAMSVALLGYPSREALLATPVEAVYANPEDRARVLALAGGGSTIRGATVELRRYDGSRITLLFDGNLIRNAKGEVVEVLGSGRLPSAVDGLQQSLLDSHQRYRSLFEDNVTPMLLASLDGRILASNAALSRLVNGDAAKRIEHVNAAAFFGGDVPWRTYVARLKESGRVEGMEQTLRRDDGSSVRVLASGRIVPTVDADDARIETSFVDIEARSQAEDSLRRAYDEREVLLREIHHRVKNNLQIVSSLLDLQARRGRSSLHDFVEISRERIRAMAMVHERLYQSADLGSIPLPEYLAALLNSLLESYDAVGRGIVLESACTDIIVDLDDGIRCGLIIHELVVNSMKHAFRERGHGTLRVDIRGLALDHERAIRIRVADDGGGFPIDFDAATAETLGVQLINGLAQQNGGTVRWSSTPGATVEVDLLLATPRNAHD